MYNHINKGDKVFWKSGNRQLEGEVVDLYKHQVINSQYESNKQQESEIRKALLIALDDGCRVLKLENEVRRAR